MTHTEETADAAMDACVEDAPAGGLFMLRTARRFMTAVRETAEDLYGCCVAPVLVAKRSGGPGPLGRAAAKAREAVEKGKHAGRAVADKANHAAGAGIKAAANLPGVGLARRKASRAARAVREKTRLAGREDVERLSEALDRLSAKVEALEKIQAAPGPDATTKPHRK